MAWLVYLHDEFELEELPEEIQDELFARLKVLSEFGPQLGRPNVDTLNGSSFPNMKELRFRKDGLWRFAFALDSLQQAIVLVGGDKEGKNQTRFYNNLIKVADARFSDHLRKIKSTLKKGKWEIDMRALNDVLGKLPPARQRKVEARAQELIAEELTLQDLRKAQKLTQEQMATVLNIGQDSISRLEKRSDMMLSTMRSYVEAMGGSLELVARFPKRGPVIITSMNDISPQPKPASRRKKPELART
jgi:DNA-binding XRE family transcriptional regulator